MKIVSRGMAITIAALSLTAWTPAASAPVTVETVLYSFKGGPVGPDGAFPNGLIADKEGALYGTTGQGGSGQGRGAGSGTVFKLTPPAQGQTAWTETVLYSFKGGASDGILPQAGLVADKEGALYGTTYAGGGGGGYGTVFKLALCPDKNGEHDGCPVFK